LQPLSKWFGRFWKRVLLLGLPSLLITIFLTLYLARPRFSIESIGPPLTGDWNLVTATIKLEGDIPIEDVSVWCSTNKVVAGYKYGLVLHDIAEIDEYDTPRLEADEPFTVRCPVGWTFWMAKNQTIAYWTLGHPGPNDWAASVPLPLVNGFPDSKSYPGMKMVRPGDESSYDVYEGTSMDGTIDIHYKWRFLPFFTRTKAFRVIGIADGSAGVKWKAIPASDPPIPDPPPLGGFSTEVEAGGKGWAITMQNRDQHP